MPFSPLLLGCLFDLSPPKIVTHRHPDKDHTVRPFNA